MLIQKAFTLRLSLNEEQQAVLAKQFGPKCFLYNFDLAFRQRAYFKNLN